MRVCFSGSNKEIASRSRFAGCCNSQINCDFYYLFLNCTSLQNKFQYLSLPSRGGCFKIACCGTFNFTLQKLGPKAVPMDPSRLGKLFDAGSLATQSTPTCLHQRPPSQASLQHSLTRVPGTRVRDRCGTTPLCTPLLLLVLLVWTFRSAWFDNPYSRMQM